MENSFVQVLALKLGSEWRALADERRAKDSDEFKKAFDRTRLRAPALAYSMIGLRTDADFLLFRFAPNFETLEETACELLKSGLGWSLLPTHSFLGIIRPSRYANKPGGQEQALIAGERAKYLVVYPFTKTPEWHLLSREDRQAMMNEHIRIGHSFAQIRQLLAHSTGVDDQEFIVSYETDDLAAFQDLVTALRETQARKYTLSDRPILTAIHRPFEEIMKMLAESRPQC